MPWAETEHVAQFMRCAGLPEAWPNYHTNLVEQELVAWPGWPKSH
jgi:hypothetical protein